MNSQPGQRLLSSRWDSVGRGIDFIEELGRKPLLANPARVKQMAEDMKTDKVDSELLANLTRMEWLPTCYVLNRGMRWLRSILRHRAFRRRISTVLKNRS